MAFGAAVALLLVPVTAEAHALVVRSDPSAGSSLAHVPGAITVTFSEAPELNLSTIEVVDASGRTVSHGPVRAVSGDALKLTEAMGPLLNGVYTVRWKTVSRDDGHSSSGTFTFGVGPSAYAASGAPVPALVEPPSSASPPVVAGHWIFYVGLGLLVGGAWVSLFALRGTTRRLLTVTLLGALAMLAGLTLYGAAQALADGTPLSDLPSDSLGLALVAQALPGLAAAACVEVALWRRGTTRTAALVLANVLAATTILVHVLTTHAASSRVAWLEVAAQWAHLAAFAAWIGGLAALLVALGSRPSPDKAAAVRRFSQVAAVSLLVVGATGLLRALDEVAAWSALAATLFGQLVLVKVALLVCLAALGAWNRFRAVPVAARSLLGLRRVGRLEIGVAGLVLLASAILTSLVPPALAQVAAKQPAPARLLVQGRALASASVVAVRATLEVSPGYPGLNRFVVRGDDAPSRRALTGKVVLRFQMPSRPEVPASTLALSRAADGTYGADGANLSLIGDWVVTAQVAPAGTAVEIPFAVACSPSPEQLQQMTMGRMPMLYGIRLGRDAQLEVYLSPGRPGRNTLHLAFTDLRDAPIDVRDTPLVTAGHGGATRSLTVLRLGFATPTPNQFYATGAFAAGRWDFVLRATAGDGSPLDARFALTIGQ
jgi:copper transport protein